MGSGGAGGPGFVPRTVEQLESVPPAVDALVGVASGAVAGLAVSPFLMSVDRAVVAAAAGTAPGGSLFRAIAASAAEFVTNPRAAFANPALWMVAGVYGCTYAAANLSDVAAERNQHVDAKVRAAGKFAATTGANMTCSVFKDAAFARIYGAAARRGGAGCTPRVLRALRRARLSHHRRRVLRPVRALRRALLVRDRRGPGRRARRVAARLPAASCKSSARPYTCSRSTSSTDPARPRPRARRRSEHPRPPRSSPGHFE